jgi:hypothetical protein
LARLLESSGALTYRQRVALRAGWLSLNKRRVSGYGKTPGVFELMKVNDEL